MASINIIYDRIGQINELEFSEIGKLLQNREKYYCLYSDLLESYRVFDYKFRTISEFKSVYTRIRKKIDLEDVYIIEFSSFIYFDWAVELINNQALQNQFLQLIPAGI